MRMCSLTAEGSAYGVLGFGFFFLFLFDSALSF